jgi:ferredoxin
VKVNVAWELCDGNGVCAIEAPTVFDLDDEDELQLLKTEFDDSERTAVEAAVRVCPKHALSIEA